MAGGGRAHYIKGSRNVWGWCQTSGTELVSNTRCQTSCFMTLFLAMPRDRWLAVVAQMVKNMPEMQVTWFNPWAGKIPWRREWQPTPVFLPGESHGQRTKLQAAVHGVTKNRTQLNDYTHSHVTCGILVPQPGIKPVPPRSGSRVLTTKLPGRSRALLYSSLFVFLTYCSVL